MFTLGLALCGAAPSLYPLVAARCFRGLGAAAIFSVNIAVVTRAFPAEDRGRALGLKLVVVALGIAAGPTVGGLDEQSGLALDLLRERARRCDGDPQGMEGADRAPARAPSAIRSPGAALLAIGLGAVTLALWFGHEWGWISPRFLVVLVCMSTLAAAAFVEREGLPHPS